jgi:hypothetical protein
MTAGEKIGIEARRAPTIIKWPGPTPEMLKDPLFKAIWQTIRTWDINVPEAYSGYCGATGNHVRAIMDAIERAAKAGEA